MLPSVHFDRPSTKARRLKLAPFSCVRKPDGSGPARLHLAGELDLATCPQFERALAQFERALDEVPKTAKVVSIDLREVTFIDAAGVEALLNASDRAAKAGTKLVLNNCSGQVKRLFWLTDLPSKVETHPFKA